MKSKVQLWGNSLALRIPKYIAKQININNGTAVVLSPSSYNSKVGLAIFCPVTSKEKGYPFEIKLPSKCPIQGVIPVDIIKNLDWRSRNAEYICKISKLYPKEISKKSRLILPD